MSQKIERTFLVGVFGENYEQRRLIGQALGAPDTKSDIELYGRLDAKIGHIFTASTPIDYPEKIKPYLQVLQLSNIHILIIDLEIGLDAAIGELLVGMDLMHQLFETRCLIAIIGINSKTEWKLPDVQEKIKKILASTNIEDTETILIKNKEDNEVLKEKIVDLGISISENLKEIKQYSKVLIDHVFPVKGIGTVILGIVREGEIKAGQMVELTGYEGPPKKVIIRNIQKHDRDFKIAYKGDRVGLALKGNISPKEISRDNIIVSQGIFKQELSISAKVFINPFYKPKTGIIKPGDTTQFHAIVDLKTTAMKFLKGDDLIPGKSGVSTIKFDKMMVHDGTGLKGLITEMNRFEKKLRIVGWFSQILS